MRASLARLTRPARPFRRTSLELTQTFAVEKAMEKAPVAAKHAYRYSAEIAYVSSPVLRPSSAGAYRADSCLPVPRQMCFVFGETSDPSEEVVRFIEDTIRLQISEMVRPPPGALSLRA